MAADAAAHDLGVLIVVGGPQYRAGSHRQFVHLARMAAQSGVPALRFDCRGMGDSEGEQREFDEMDDDIASALEALLRERPTVRRVVVCALCDGASATLLYLRRRGPDPRVAGLVLMNPWVRTLAGQAETRVRHYYRERLMSADFWRKLLSGRVARGALKEAWSAVRTALAARRAAAPAPATQVASAPAVPTPAAAGGSHFIQVMAEGCQRFAGPLLVVTSGRDYTAKEFLLACARDERWREVLARPSTRHVELPQADHTFSSSGDERTLHGHCLGWLQGLRAA